MSPVGWHEKTRLTIQTLVARSQGMSESILRLTAEDYRTPAIKFTDYANILPMFDGLAFNEPLILVGPAGVGKSIGIAHFAHKHEVPLITYGCAEDSRRSHLVGNYKITGGDTQFVLGAVTTAIDIANEVGSAILCLEEVNALSPQTQKTLNGLMDYRQSMDVGEAGKKFALKEGKKLWVVGTMNFSVYGGVYELNTDFKSRFEFLDVGYPNKAIEEKLIFSECGDVLPSKEVKNIITWAEETRKGVEKGAVNYALSPRDTCRITRVGGRMGIEKALRLALNKFSLDDRPVATAGIKRIWGLSL